MKTLENYGSMRAAVRALGPDGFVAAVLRRARTRERWEELVEEARQRARRSGRRGSLAGRFFSDAGSHTTSGPSLGLG
jgi:hypothetical protein